MSYPPPPGLQNSSTAQSHGSLPARPPRTSFHSSNTTSQGGFGHHGNTGTSSAFMPGTSTYGGQDWRTNSPAVTSGPSLPPSYQHYGGGYQQHAQYPQQNDSQAYGGYNPTPPQIHNPFPNPGDQPQYHGAGNTRYSNQPYDPEYEAQVAQWQSAYASKDDQSGGTKNGSASSSAFPAATGANAGAVLGSRTANTITAQPLSSQELANAAQGESSGVANVVAGSDGKQKTVVRSGGGKTWQDQSLLEWDPAHFRLFIGNLAGEVTDESLLKAFAKYGSVQKARVVRDKRTTKSKGYGFVSFSDGDDYFEAAKDMQGKYIGSHPVLIKKSTTEIKAVNQSEANKNKGRKGRSGEGDRDMHNANTGAGVHKKQNNKMKGGLKLLG